VDPHHFVADPDADLELTHRPDADILIILFVMDLDPSMYLMRIRIQILASKKCSNR
jgi:hypothetical protein